MVESDTHLEDSRAKAKLPGEGVSTIQTRVRFILNLTELAAQRIKQQDLSRVTSPVDNPCALLRVREVHDAPLSPQQTQTLRTWTRFFDCRRFSKLTRSTKYRYCGPEKSQVTSPFHKQLRSSHTLPVRLSASRRQHRRTSSMEATVFVCVVTAVACALLALDGVGASLVPCLLSRAFQSLTEAGGVVGGPRNVCVCLTV